MVSATSAKSVTFIRSVPATCASVMVSSIDGSTEPSAPSAPGDRSDGDDGDDGDDGEDTTRPWSEMRAPEGRALG